MASVQQTASVAMPVGAGLIVLQYLTHPSWPPPDPILTIVATGLAPIAHAAYNGLYALAQRWATKVEEEVAPFDPRLMQSPGYQPISLRSTENVVHTPQPPQPVPPAA